MTGLEVAAALHGMRPDLPILIATGMMEAEDFTVPDSIGVVQVLRKPVPPTDLVRIIDEAIRNAAPLEA
jgi:CheY-like chemotaxis protein